MLDAFDRRKAAPMTSRSRKRRSAGRTSAVVQDNKPTAMAFVSSDREELTAEELDFLLLERGWVAVDRAQNYAVYDWPPSAPHAQHDITYLIVDLTGRFSFPPYRVSIVNDDPIEYDSAATLVDNLGRIEARRCSGRGHRGRR